MHTLVGGGGQYGGFDALDYRKIKHGDAGPLGIYPILSVLPDKFARFLFEFQAVRFESLDLPPLPADRSDFDVHGAPDLINMSLVQRSAGTLRSLLTCVRVPLGQSTVSQKTE